MYVKMLLATIINCTIWKLEKDWIREIFCDYHIYISIYIYKCTIPNHNTVLYIFQHETNYQIIKFFLPTLHFSEI